MDLLYELNRMSYMEGLLWLLKHGEYVMVECAASILMTLLRGTHHKWPWTTSVFFPFLTWSSQEQLQNVLEPQHPEIKGELSGITRAPVQYQNRMPLKELPRCSREPQLYNPGQPVSLISGVRRHWHLSEPEGSVPNECLASVVSF